MNRLRTFLLAAFAATSVNAQDLRTALYVWDIEAGTVELAVAEPEDGRRHLGSPDWSPDGTDVAF